MHFSECDYYGTWNMGPIQIIQADKRIFLKLPSKKAIKIFQDGYNSRDELESIPFHLILIFEKDHKRP